MGTVLKAETLSVTADTAVASEGAWGQEEPETHLKGFKAISCVIKVGGTALT